MKTQQIEIHVFNTRRHYTEHGQRIAWRELAPGVVSMVDVDRNIDYMLIVPSNPSNADVLFSYDYQGVHPWDETLYAEHRRTLKVLENAAKGEPPAIALNVDEDIQYKNYF